MHSWALVIFSASPRHKGTCSVARLARQDCPSCGVKPGAADPSPVLGSEEGLLIEPVQLPLSSIRIKGGLIEPVQLPLSSIRIRGGHIDPVQLPPLQY